MKNEICRIGSKIAYYRNLHCMTQDNLAEVLGLSTRV